MSVKNVKLSRYAKDVIGNAISWGGCTEYYCKDCLVCFLEYIAESKDIANLIDGTFLYDDDMKIIYHKSKGKSLCRSDKNKNLEKLIECTKICKL